MSLHNIIGYGAMTVVFGLYAYAIAAHFGLATVPVAVREQARILTGCGL